MKKSVYSYFKPHFILLFALQIIIAFLSIIGYFYFREGTMDDWGIPICGLVDILCLQAVILICANNLTYAIITEDKIESYSLLKRKLCTIDLDKQFYYARLKVPNRNAKYGYIDAIFISNENFKCKRNFLGGEVVEKFNNKKMAMFPFDESLIFLINSKHAERVN